MAQNITRILVMEEYVPYREVLSELLVLKGFEVYQANDGQSGLQIAKEYLPDLIICSRMFHDMNCWEVLQALQSNKPTSDIPFLFLSSKPAGKYHDKMEGSKKATILVKPFFINECMNIIDNLSN